jgi:hypothetical protein
MTMFDSHPEALIELEKHGELSAAQRLELKGHLLECSACALELWAYRAFNEELRARPEDVGLDRRAVERALASVARPAANRWGRWRVGRWLVAAALPISAWATIGVFRRTTIKEPAASLLTPESRAIASLRPNVPLQMPPSALASATPSLLESSAPTQRPSLLTAAQLFQRAGSLRRNGDKQRAIELYRELEQRFSSSPEAHLASVIAGQLLLESHQPTAALAEFDRYLERGGPAAEESLVGRANALGQLGRAPNEAAAWRLLLARFPRSVHAANAQRRLALLGAGVDSAGGH